MREVVGAVFYFQVFVYVCTQWQYEWKTRDREHMYKDEKREGVEKKKKEQRYKQGKGLDKGDLDKV
jgi:hypothetical protein